MSSVLSDVNRGELAPSVRPQRRASLHRAPTALRAGLARRLAIVFAAAAMLFVTIPAAAAAEMDGDKSMDADMPAYAMRWWNVLTPEQMVAALHGDGASEAQMMAAKKMYADLDEQTRGLVNAAAKSIYQGGPFASVGSWWESLDCRLMRVAAGDGITADSSSKFCAHYPGSDHEKILMEDALMHVNKVGMALLGHDDAGTYPAAEVDYAMRWWNVLTPEQMVAALHGDGASEAQMMAAKKMYADLDEQTRGLVNAAAKSIYQGGPFASVGSWWESLDCRLMRVAAGDGITADSSSKFCAHYPGSDHEKILMEDALMHVNKVGMALLGHDDAGTYPAAEVDYAMRWWNVLTPEQMVAALHGDGASEAQMMAAKKMYADLDEQTRGLVNAAAKSIYQGGPFASVGSWWESLDCRLMRVAAGDGITADSSSKFCAHYPGSDHEKILMEDALMHVNKVGMALLGHDDAGTYPAAEVDYAMRWWNVLTPEQMVAALHGDGASEAQMMAAKKMYADLDEQTRGLVNAAAKSIYQGGPFASVGSWWESLDCRLMRVAAGDGITADSSSKFCAHYPGSDHEKILMEDALMHVNKVGMALLGRDDPGKYPAEMADDDMDGDKSGDDMDDMMDGDKSGDDMDGDKADDMMDGDKSGDDMDDMMDGDKADAMKSDGVYYTVKPGDYLRKIAEMYLGHASHWTKIYEANKGKKQADGRTFTNPDLIIAGWVLHIPGA